MPKKRAASKSSMEFEEAIDLLEVYLEELETEVLPLSALVAKFEDASKLLIECHGQLSAAQGRIDAVHKRTETEVIAKPFKKPASSSAKEIENDDEIRLF